MRINLINSYTYSYKISNTSNSHAITLPDTFEKSPSFNGWFTSRKVSKFMTKDVPYNNPENREAFMELCERINFSKAQKLVEKAKFILQNPATSKNNALYAIQFLLLGLNNGTLAKVENRDYVLNLLKTVVDENGDSLILDVNTSDDLDLCLQAKPEIDVNKHYYKNGKASSLILNAVKARNPELTQYLFNRDDFDLYNLELWTNVLKFSTTTDLFLKEIPKEKFQINHLVLPDGNNLLTEVLSKDYPKSIAIQLLKNYPDLDTNVCIDGTHPLLKYYPGGDKDINIPLFKALYSHPRTDRSVFINSGIVPFYELQKFILKTADNDFEKHFKTLYEINGTFYLDEMVHIVNYSNFKKYVNTRVNIVGDRFGHLLSDIRVDENNSAEIEKLEHIINRLKDTGYAFNAANDLNQTPLAKALEADNKPVINLLRRYI